MFCFHSSRRLAVEYSGQNIKTPANSREYADVFCCAADDPFHGGTNRQPRVDWSRLASGHCAPDTEVEDLAPEATIAMRVDGRNDPRVVVFELVTKINSNDEHRVIALAELGNSEGLLERVRDHDLGPRIAPA